MKIIVAGGGPAGMAAAIAAARAGAEVTLIESMGYVGGDNGPIGHNFFNGFHNAKTGKQTINGIPQEVVDRLMEAGVSMGHLIIPTGQSITPFSAEGFRFVADKVVMDAGVKLMLHSSVADAEVEDGLISHIVVSNRDGLNEHSADIYIDATGDGHLFAHAGAPFFKGKPEDVQRSTLMFKFSHVNIDRIFAYAKSLEDGARQDLDDSPLTGEEPDSVEFAPHFLGVFGFSKWVALFNAEAAGEGKPEPFPRRIVIALSDMIPGEYWMLMTDVAGDASTAAGITELEIAAREQVWGMIPYLRRIPGFEGAALSQVANRIGVRETRHLTGEHVLTGDDVINGAEFEDVICQVGMAPDMHDTPRQPFFRPTPIESDRGMYDIPYRTLLPLEIDNLLVAGRCISGDEVASSSLRFGPVCMGTGQVAGFAAVMSIQNNVTPRSLDVKMLQDKLKSSGAL